MIGLRCVSFSFVCFAFWLLSFSLFACFFVSTLCYCLVCFYILGFRFVVVIGTAFFACACESDASRLPGSIPFKFGIVRLFSVEGPLCQSVLSF